MTPKYLKQKKEISSRARVTAGALICSALSAAAAALYFIAYHTGIYERDIHHYAKSSPIPAAVAILLFLSFAVSIITALSVKKSDWNNSADLPSPSVSFGAYLTAFMFIGYFIASLYSWAPLPEDVGFGDICSRVCIFLGLLSAVPFICDGSGRVRRGSFHRAMSFFPVIWGAFLMFKYYFDLKEIPLNDPELILTDISIAAVVLFFLTESRRALDITSPFKNTAASFLASFIALPISAVRILLCKTDSLSLPDMMENILLASIGIFAVLRIINDAGFFTDSDVEDALTEDEASEVRESDALDAQN